MSDDVEAIRKRLTFVEQCFLTEGRIRAAWPFEAKARDRLVSKGLIRKRWFSYRFTPLGERVRQSLLSSPVKE